MSRVCGRVLLLVVSFGHQHFHAVHLRQDHRLQPPRNLQLILPGRRVGEEQGIPQLLRAVVNQSCPRHKCLKNRDLLSDASAADAADAEFLLFLYIFVLFNSTNNSKITSLCVRATQVAENTKLKCGCHDAVQVACTAVEVRGSGGTQLGHRAKRAVAPGTGSTFPPSRDPPRGRAMDSPVYQNLAEL